MPRPSPGTLLGLRRCSSKVLSELFDLWNDPKARGLEFSSDGEFSSWRFTNGLRLLSALTEAMKYHPDIKELYAIRKQFGVMKDELEAFKRLRPLHEGNSELTQTA